MNETRMHIAFLCPAAYGHVNPTLPLVSELLARGHRITYATGQSLVPVVEATGATALSLPTELPADPWRLIDFSVDGLSWMLQYWLEGARADLPPAIAHFQQDRPDALCYDVSSFVGQILAQRLGVPGITLCPTFAGHEKFSYLELLLPADFDPTDQRLTRFSTDIQELGAEFGVTIDPDQPAFGRPTALNLVFLPKEFQLAADTFDDRFHFVGPSLRRSVAADDWQPPASAERVLYVSLGTIFNDRPEFFRTCAEAFAGTDWHVVLALGSRVTVDQLGPLPANVEAGAYLPQASILRHASVAVSHGGMNTIMDSLSLGVPVVVVPDTAARLNAARVEELRLGRELPNQDVSPENLRQVVEDLATDPEVAEATAWMRQRIGDCGGARAGAEAIEAHLRGERAAE